MYETGNRVIRVVVLLRLWPAPVGKRTTGRLTMGTHLTPIESVVNAHARHPLVPPRFGAYPVSTFTPLYRVRAGKSGCSHITKTQVQTNKNDERCASRRSQGAMSGAQQTDTNSRPDSGFYLESSQRDTPPAGSTLRGAALRFCEQDGDQNHARAVARARIGIYSARRKLCGGRDRPHDR